MEKEVNKAEARDVLSRACDVMLRVNGVSSYKDATAILRIINQYFSDTEQAKKSPEKEIPKKE